MPFVCPNILNTLPDSSEQGINFILFHVGFLNKMHKKETLVLLLGILALYRINFISANFRMAVTALRAISGFIQETLSSLKSITFLNKASSTILAFYYKA